MIQRISCGVQLCMKLPFRYLEHLYSHEIRTRGTTDELRQVIANGVQSEFRFLSGVEQSLTYSKNKRQPPEAAVPQETQIPCVSYWKTRESPKCR